MINTPLLTAQHISLTRGGKHILSDLSISLSRGDCVALLGANGAGKTSLIEILAGLIKPTTGTVVCNESKGITSSAGFFYRALSVSENLSLVGPLDSVRDLINRLQVQSILSRPVNKLSRGEFAKVSFIRAMIGQPKVLLLDELSASLDDGSLSVILAELKKFKDVGAILFATHDERRLDGLFTTVARLEHGSFSSKRSFIPEVVLS